MTRTSSQGGFTLAEALVAMAILGIALASVMPAFVTFMDSNSHSEERSDAVAAAQFVLEDWRQQNVAGLPNSGTVGPTLVTVGDRDFEVSTSFCTDSSLCGTGFRQLQVEVSFGGQVVYSASSVFGDY